MVWPADPRHEDVPGDRFVVVNSAEQVAELQLATKFFCTSEEACGMQLHPLQVVQVSRSPIGSTIDWEAGEGYVAE